MPRALRLNYSGLFFHVMARGNNRGNIFIDESDYEVFTRIVRIAIVKHEFEVHAYCFMPNHLHFLLRTVEANLSAFMGWTLGSYARYFNQKYKRVGHVFQGRFLAKIVAKPGYLLEVGRYIHMNPVKGGLAARPDGYRWSSMDAYLDGSEEIPVTRGAIALESHKSFYEFTIASNKPLSDGLKLPGNDWYDADALKPRESNSSKLDKSKSTDVIIEKVANYFKCDPKMLTLSRRNPAMGNVRGLAMLALREKCFLSLREIGGVMGIKTQEGVCSSISRFKTRMESSNELKRAVQDLGLSLG